MLRIAVIATSIGEAKGIEDEGKIKMMKARSNKRAANRGDILARAALMCGPGSKICPPDRATELLEAIIEPRRPGRDRR